MIVSKETLILEANRTGFRAEILEKVIRLIDLLNAFANNEYLAPRIALKGGTALNLFHFDLPRLSVDIDLNYIGSSDRETMLNERPQLIASIEKICIEKKYQSFRKPSEHAGGKWSIGYKSALIQQGQLEIDLNFISRVPLWPVVYMDSKQIGRYQAKSIPVLEYHDLIGGKLAALFARRKSRDLFDAYSIFGSPEKLDDAKVRLTFLIYGASARMDIRKISIDHLDFDPFEMKNMLLPVLRDEQLKDKKTIITWSQSLIGTCKQHLTRIISYTQNELDFLTGILDHGKLTPEFLTHDTKLIETLNKHPVLLWKCLNVQEHKKLRK